MRKYLFTLFVCILPFNSTAHTGEMPGIVVTLYSRKHGFDLEESFVNYIDNSYSEEKVM